jgi:hypothetical protein
MNNTDKEVMEYTDYQLEQQFLLKKQWYKEGQGAAYDGRDSNTNPYTKNSIPSDEWSSGYCDGSMGMGREY